MNTHGSAFGQGGHYQHHSSTTSPHFVGVTPRTLFGTTFDSRPFSVEIDPSAFDHGASAGIYKGLSSQEPWGRPLVVAVRVFGHMLKPAQQQLLVRELLVASQASLRHPLILPFLGTVDSGDQKSLVSLYMKNGNLLEYLKSHRGCDKKKLLLQVAKAVDYLHGQAHLVHGDLKCENVLISDCGDALLADFGLSTFVEKSQSDVTTMTGIRDMNTVRFAAPELLRGADDTAVRPRSKTVESDVYAFGMLILQAVTELAPWFNESAFAVVHKVCQGQHPPQPTDNGFVTISHSWWCVCRRFWSHTPGDRPAMHAVLSLLGDTNLDPCQLLHCYFNHAQSLVYFPDGCRVVSAYLDGTIRIWDIVRGLTVISPMRGHEGPVYSVAVSPDGWQICSGGSDCTIRRWDTEYGAPIGYPMTGHDDKVRCVAFSPDGSRIVSCSFDKMVRLWDATTGEALGRPLMGHTNRVWSVTFSPDGTCIASGSEDSAVRLWDGATGAELGALHHPEMAVYSVCFSPDQTHLISSCDDGVIRIWHISTQQLARNIKAHSDFVRSVTISPSGRYIASGSDDKTIRIWDAQTGDAVGAPLIGHNSWVLSLAFSPDGRSLMSCSHDDMIRIWDLFE